MTEVSKSNYDACSASKPIKVYTDGSTTIPLSTPGKRYFICGTQGHCLQGMKIEVNVLATTTSPPSSAPKASPPSSSPKSSPPSSSPSGSPQSAPTTPSPSSSESPEANGPSSELSPTAPTTQTPESSPAPSAASANYEGSFRAGIVVVFGAFLMLLAF